VTYDEEGKLQVPTNYVATLLRYKYYVVMAIVILAGLSIFAVKMVPSIYRSEAIVLVETQQIPDELVKSTVTSVAAERIQIIKQRVMTREKLLNIANKYPDLKGDSDNVLISSLVEELREAITVEMMGDGRRHANTIAFKLGFDSRDPQIAQSVANDLVTLFLDENVKSRTERATETTDFLKTEAEKLKRRLAQTEQAIADFKQKHKDALPEHLNLYMNMLQRAQESRVDLQRQIEAERNQRSLYEVQLSSAPGAQVHQGRLQQLYSEYEQLSSIYQENHPDIQRLQGEIASLESSAPATSNVGTVIKQKIASSNRQLALLGQQLGKTNNEIRELEEKVLTIPDVERGLLTLNRDYKSVKGQYDQVLNNTMQAQMAESLEQGRKAERFSILEPPQLPDQPHSPDRKQLMAAGIGASVSIPIAIVLLLGFLDKSVRGAVAVEAVTGNAPLVVIPLITTKEEIRKKRNRTFLIIVCITLAVIAAVGLIHFYVKPLDMLLYKLMFKFGLS
jgi:polysaccharide chain length determinant protein (PEP-CTERM system associated)